MIVTGATSGLATVFGGGATALGFSSSGIVGGSVAAGIQAGIGNVAAGSLFAGIQSVAALGIFSTIGVVGGVGLAGVGVYYGAKYGYQYFKKEDKKK